MSPLLALTWNTTHLLDVGTNGALANLKCEFAPPAIMVFPALKPPAPENPILNILAQARGVLLTAILRFVPIEFTPRGLIADGNALPAGPGRVILGLPNPNLGQLEPPAMSKKGFIATLLVHPIPLIAFTVLINKLIVPNAQVALGPEQTLLLLLTLTLAQVTPIQFPNELANGTVLFLKILFRVLLYLIAPILTYPPLATLNTRIA